ncbi:hypothetical protein ABIA33_000179 [Streptacidiphilus sp. MAP12-16]|uniref:serine/threonine-protein kinase n=1 Tax=Streptacidiphilus sp. MAP12-16 TaxID=3156300 RepID=UPI0035149936
MEPLGAGDPRQIGAYRLLGRLGAGGMGRVYLGRTAGGRTVAVKLVRTELADDTDFRARFRQEVAAARLVGGRWTAAVLDADTESEQPWVATGYVPGPGLDAAVREFGPLPEASVQVLGVGLADSLAAVHATGLVHRDLKPSNVLLTLDGPRLIDFGIARALDAATALTRSGYVVGSPGYMSPEQGAGEAAGAPSDVFSLGGVLAYAATGVGPFGDSVSAPVLLYRVIHEPPRLDAMADGPLRQIVERCLAKEPGARPALDELRAALGGLGPADGWLPPLLVASVGRRTAELLDLETDLEAEATEGVSHSEPDRGGGGGRAGFGPPPASYGSLPVPPPPGTVADRQPEPAGTPPSGVTAGGSPSGSAGDSAGDSAGSGTPPFDKPPGRPLWRAPAVVGGAVLVVLAAVLVPLLMSHQGGNPVIGAGGSTTPAVSTPAQSASAGPTATAPTTAPGAPASPPSSPPAPPSPGPSSPNAVPAVFLGTWTGTMTTQDGLLTEEMSITIRPGPKGVENTTSITTVPGLAGTACLGGERLSSATATSITFQDRLLPGSSATVCSSNSDAQVFTLNPDGTLHHQVNAAGSGNPSGDFHKVR